MFRIYLAFSSAVREAATFVQSLVLSGFSALSMHYLHTELLKK